MNLRLLLFVFLIFSAFNLQSQEYLEMIDAGNYSVEEIIVSAETYFENRDKGRGSGFKQFKRWEYNAKRLMKEDGYLPSITENLFELQQYEAYLNQNAQNRLPLNDNWEELGPTNWNGTTSWNPGVGRVTGIAIDPLDNDHIIVGANTGGVWKTEDGAAIWIPLHDNFSNLYVYSVAMDPTNSNIYFFGSRDGLIFKSIDAGATWNLLNDLGSSIVNKILIHPTDSNIMFASLQNGGISRSIDAGVTWDQTVFDNNGYDIEFNTADPMIVYASGGGFHKSIDGGATFTNISGFLGGPKMIGVSEADPNKVYVLEADSGRFGAIYSSSDAGESFMELLHGTNNYFGYSTIGDDNYGQAPRDMDIAVNPNDANEVHIAGVLTWRSTDGGANFTCTADWIPNAAANANIGYCHADVDIMLFEGNTLYVGTDGGIFKAEDTSDISANYYTDISTGLGIRQFYKIGVSQNQEVIITGGSQDNGTSFYTEADGWKDWLGADGMEGFVDKDNSNVMYGMIQFGEMYRTDNGANSYIYIGSPDGEGNWVTPFEQDPVTVNTVYSGFTQVFKSENKGGSWTPISQDFNSNLNNLKIAASNNQIMYVSRSSQIFRTEDGGATDWIQLSSPGGLINSIAIHPANPNKIAVATTGFNRVFVSEDGGQTWQNYKKNLPGFSALALVWDNNGQDGLYLGMNYGIYYIDNSFTDWQPYNNNLPNVIINELDINSTTNMLYAATYGRGLWASPLVEDIILGVTERGNQPNFLLTPNPTNSEITIALPHILETDIRIFDLTGKLMVYKADTLISNSYTMDVSSLPTGVYFVRLSSEDGVVTKKLIKE